MELACEQYGSEWCSERGKTGIKKKTVWMLLEFSHTQL
jgi:hypothetical protein